MKRQLFIITHICENNLRSVRGRILDTLVNNFIAERFRFDLRRRFWRRRANGVRRVEARWGTCTGYVQWAIVSVCSPLANNCWPLWRAWRTVDKMTIGDWFLDFYCFYFWLLKTKIRDDWKLNGCVEGGPRIKRSDQNREIIFFLYNVVNQSKFLFVYFICKVLCRKLHSLKSSSTHSDNKSHDQMTRSVLCFVSSFQGRSTNYIRVTSRIRSTFSNVRMVVCDKNFWPLPFRRGISSLSMFRFRQFLPVYLSNSIPMFIGFVL